MVLMGVGGDNPQQAVAVFDDEGRVCDHDIDAGLRIVAKGDAAIDDQPLAAIAVEVEVHADLAGAAERQEIERVGIAHRRVVCGEGRGEAHRLVL